VSVRTSTVVGAAMLAALGLSWKNLAPGPKTDATSADSETEVSDSKDEAMVTDDADQSAADKDHVLDRGVLSANALALTSCAPSSAQLFDAAARSARMCVCEGRVSIAKARILRCQDCGHTCCEQCAGRPEHNYVPDNAQRLNPGDFESELKKALPMRVGISGFTREALDKTLEDVKDRLQVDNLWERYAAAISDALHGAEVPIYPADNHSGAEADSRLAKVPLPDAHS
jgi:hypothetical protein